MKYNPISFAQQRDTPVHDVLRRNEIIAKGVACLTSFNSCGTGTYADDIPKELLYFFQEYRDQIGANVSDVYKEYRILCHMNENIYDEMMVWANHQYFEHEDDFPTTEDFLLFFKQANYNLIFPKYFAALVIGARAENLNPLVLCKCER